jgi:hypothetical protein
LSFGWIFNTFLFTFLSFIFLLKKGVFFVLYSKKLN